MQLRELKPYILNRWEAALWFFLVMMILMAVAFGGCQTTEKPFLPKAMDSTPRRGNAIGTALPGNNTQPTFKNTDPMADVAMRIVQGPYPTQPYARTENPRCQ